MLKINLLSFILIVFNCFGQENYTTTSSKIREVKIYSNGGIIKHSFSADVAQGKNFIIIKEFGRNSGMDISSFRPDKKLTFYVTKLITVTTQINLVKIKILVL